jgi:outer membrane protein TolC
MNRHPHLRRAVAAGLCLLWPAALSYAQQQDIAPERPQAPVLWRPYEAPAVPSARLANSPRLRDLIRAGNLYLTAQDAISLALENNVDVEVSRYDGYISEWNVERSQAGGALPGVPSGASTANSVASGQGLQGAQSAAGISSGGANQTSRSSGNATVAQVGPTAQTFDPVIQESTTFSHRTLLEPNTTASETPYVVDQGRTYSGSYQQGFVYGGSATISYSEHYLNENAPTDILNPSVSPSLSVSYQQNLLNGFGRAVNERSININKINYQTSDLNFRTSVIGTIVNVLDTYYALVADYESIRSKQATIDTARQFLAENRSRVEIGTLAELDVTTAQSQLATSEQGLVDANASLKQHELTLKGLISRTGLGDPLIANAHIIPLDPIEIPPSDDLPPVKDMVRLALANRSDLAAERNKEKGDVISAIGTKSGILPVLVGFGTTSAAGVSGKGQPVTFQGFTLAPEQYFVGGIGNALAQIFRRNFPTEVAGVFYSQPINNRQAQADYGIDQLSLRQTQLIQAKDVKQAEVDVMNAVTALRQARAKYEAAEHAQELDEQLYDAETKKFNLGASTPYDVVTQQRDLEGAKSTKLAALLSYSNAKVALDQALGRTLEANHIIIGEARTGKVARLSSIPATVAK